MPLLIDVRRRRLQPELMDQPGLDPRQHDEALRGLERVNRLSRSAAILWPSIRSLARRLHPRPARVLDVATGAGDVPVGLWQFARRAGLDLRIDGCDRSAQALEHARSHASQRQAPIGFFQHDVLEGDLPAGYDASTCSLFLHHLDETQALHLLQRMARAAPLLLVNDLVRSTTGYLAAWVGTRLLSASPIVHVDGPRSVTNAFTPAEVRALAERAGLHGASVRWRWPFRYLLRWSRS